MSGKSTSVFIQLWKYIEDENLIAWILWQDTFGEEPEGEFCAKVIVLLVVMLAEVFTRAWSASVYMEERLCCSFSGVMSGYYSCICKIYRETCLTLKILKFLTTTSYVCDLCLVLFCLSLLKWKYSNVLQFASRCEHASHWLLF